MSGCCASRCHRFVSSFGISALLILCIGSKLGLPTARAVTINLSLSNLTDSPGFDPTGAKMLIITQAAAEIWMDIIEDPYVIDVEIGYQNSSKTFSCYAQGGDCIDGDVQASTPNLAFIRFDTMQANPDDPDGPEVPVPWFFDNTPLDNSEYDLQQLLVRSLTPGNVDFFYSDTTPPDLMEAGMLGAALSPTDEIDALTVALHELGHILGTLNEISLPETMPDDAYDVDPDFVNGASVEVATFLGDGEHLASTIALMRDTAVNDQRVLPSATDVFAIAAGAEPNWISIDLPRQDFLGGTVWEVLSNWEGNSLPDDEDDAFVRNGSDVTMFANHEVANLLVAEGSSVELDQSTLTVGGTVTVGGAGGGTAYISAPVDALLQAEEVRIGNDGRLLTAGSIFDVSVDASDVVIEQGGVLTGTGRVRADNISNSGAVTAVAPVGSLVDVLALDSKPGGQINLDGDGGGQLFAVLASVLVSGPLTDAFDGEITVGAGRSIIFDEPWTFGTPPLGDGVGAGVINLNGGNNDTELATLDTQGWTARSGRINVTGRANILRATEFLSGIEVNVAAGGVLDLDGLTTFSGGTYTGGGTLVLNNSVVVDAATSADISRFDLDGDSFGQTLTLNAPLALNVDFIDTGNNVFNGDTIDINFNGQLAVNLKNANGSWTMGGTLNINSGIFPQTVLNGSEINVTGTVNADGASVIAAPLDVSGTFNFVDTQSRVTLSSPPLLRVAQHVIRESASVTGGGTLVIGGDAILVLEDHASVGASVQNDGEFQIGNSPGEVQVGSYQQSVDAVWSLDIGGPLPGENLDQLHVVGQADLAGLLEVLLIDDYVPNVGDEFTVLTAGRVLNTFDDLTTTDEASLLSVELTAQYMVTTVVLQVADVGLVGDFNDDGVVNAADYIVWRKNLGAPEGSLPNDIDGGPIGTPQYETWKAHFGNVFPESSASQAAAVPEPAMLVLPWIGAISLLAYRVSRKRGAP